MGGGSSGRWRSLFSASLTVVVSAGLAALLCVLVTSAQPTPGATYTGSITGCASPPCGAVQFTVSGDASKVSAFTASDVPGDTCVFSGSQQYPIPLDIVADSFGPGIPNLYEVSGSFPSENSAQGTLRLVLDDPLCDTGTLNWSAATGDTTPTPTPPPACLPDGDTDGDGFDDDVECYIGTDSLDDCPDSSEDDAWPPDIDISTQVNVVDIVMYKPVLGGPYDPRYDLDVSGVVNIVDVVIYKPVLGTSCTNP